MVFSGAHEMPLFVISKLDASPKGRAKAGLTRRLRPRPADDSVVEWNPEWPRYGVWEGVATAGFAGAAVAAAFLYPTPPHRWDGPLPQSFIDGQNRLRILNVSSSAVLRAPDGSSARVLGVTRLPGVAEDCGVAGFAPTDEPRQNTVCSGSNDIVVFTPQFGAPLPPAPSSGPAIQVVVDPQGRVVSAGTPGGTLPAGDWAVQAIGTDEAWLASHAKAGARLSVSERLRTRQGQQLQLNPATTVTSAGPLLLRNGRPAIDAVAEGVLDPRDLNDYTFSAYRHARTMIGVDRQGRILLATVDGIPAVSEGMTLTEEAALMRSLGAVDAMNLDGGGSTQFASFGQVLDDPSSSPLRPVGDTVEAVPSP